MRHKQLCAPLAAALALAALWNCSAVLASLGDDAGSVATDSTALQGQLRSTPMTQYAMQEISRDGLIVREYVTLQGRVFAITWQGPAPPDLRQLLGSYFARFQSAAVAAHQSAPGMHRQFALAQSDLVIQSSGRLRGFRGIAYLPPLLPAGVSPNQLP